MYRENKKMTGTARYASLATHMGAEQSRRDDLECLCHSAIYLMKGQLPWQGIHTDNKHEKYEKIKEMKASLKIETLCKDLPFELVKFMRYCRILKFEDKPDYDELRKLFKDLFYQKQFNKDFAFDWEKIDLKSNLPRGNTISADETNIADCPNRRYTKPKNSQNELIVSDLSTPKTVQSIHLSNSQATISQPFPKCGENNHIEISNDEAKQAHSEVSEKVSFIKEQKHENNLDLLEPVPNSYPLIKSSFTFQASPKESNSCDFQEIDIVEDPTLFCISIIMRKIL